MGPPRGTRKTIWDHLGAPPKPDTEKTFKNIVVGTVLGPSLNVYLVFNFVSVLVFTRVQSEGHEVKMSQNMQTNDA